MYKDEGKKRLKDLDAGSRAYYESLSPELKSFVQDYEQVRGKVFKLTSGKRDSSPSGKFSHHHNGDALDFSHVDYEEYNFLMNTKEGLSLMSRYNLGVIDETDPEMMKKTKATGAHFHVGKDTKYSAKIKERLSTWDTGVDPIYSYKQRYEMGEDPNEIIKDKEDHTGHKHAEGEHYVPFEDKQYEDIFGRVTEKAVIQDVKTENSADRKELKETMTTQEAFLEAYSKDVEKEVDKYGQMSSSEVPVQPININIDLQSQLPDLSILS